VQAWLLGSRTRTSHTSRLATLPPLLTIYLRTPSSVNSYSPTEVGAVAEAASRPAKDTDRPPVSPLRLSPSSPRRGFFIAGLADIAFASVEEGPNAAAEEDDEEDADEEEVDPAREVRTGAVGDRDEEEEEDEDEEEDSLASMAAAFWCCR
jgi:hypothetical protein